MSTAHPPVPSVPSDPGVPPRLRALRVKPSGEVVRGSLELLEGEGLLWLDVAGQTEADLAMLAQRFNFHPLALEDCAHLDQRPKLEDFGDYLFVVQHAFSEDGGPLKVELHELHAFLGRDYLVTVHADRIPAVDAVFARMSEPGLAARGPDYIFYLLSDLVTDQHFDVLDDVATAIEDLEDEVLERPSRASIRTAFSLKRALVSLRRTLSPARDVFGQISRHSDGVLRPKNLPYFRDVFDHLVRVNESIESSRDLLGNALDAYQSSIANRTNEIVKQLTMFSVIFLPLSFITGFFGQNFTDLLPFNQPWLFDLMLASCAIVPAGMLAWFLRRSWL